MWNFYKPIYIEKIKLINTIRKLRIVTWFLHNIITDQNGESSISLSALGYFWSVELFHGMYVCPFALLYPVVFSVEFFELFWPQIRERPAICVHIHICGSG